MTPRKTFRTLTAAAAGCLVIAVSACAPPPQSPAPVQQRTTAVDESWPQRDERLAGGQKREIQRILAALGYNPGLADGVMGASTRAAIRDYQAATRRRADGIVSTELLAALRADAAAEGIRYAEEPRQPARTTTTRRPTQTTVATPRQTPPPAQQQTPPAATPAEEEETPTFVRNEAPDWESDTDSGGGWN